MLELISVIMSTYNEPIDMINDSINSILNQSYNNIEFIIVNDNPSRKELKDFLLEIRKNYSIIYLENNNNIGLVKSLNKALSVANGKYIARMDADDISDKYRLEKQLDFLKKKDLDIVGSCVVLIDEVGKEIGYISVPTSFDRIKRFYKIGSCVLHPTWLVKKKVFDSLDGYRNILACEDYDFVLRALDKGFKVGNIEENLLFYRVRKNGVSVSLESKQKLITYYLQKNITRIQEIDEETINEYIESEQFKKELVRINEYINAKNSYKINNNIKIGVLLKLLSNKYFYINTINCFIRKYMY